MDRRRRMAALTRERTQLVAYLRELSAEEWHAPSQAQGWSVGDIVAHLAATTRALAGPGALRVVGSDSAESYNDEQVARRRHMPPGEVLDEFVRTSATATRLLRLATRGPLASLRIPIAELGSYPMRLTPSLLIFDWHVHLRHDIAPAIGKAPYALEPDSMAAVLEWMFAGMEQMNRHSMGWVDRPLSIELTGTAGGSWRIAPGSGGRLRVAPHADATDTVARIRGASDRFPLWATTRIPWRDGGLTISGDIDHAHRFLDSLNIV